MTTYVFVIIGILISILGVVLAIIKRRLYKFGIKKIAKVVSIETFTYLTPGPEFNTLYHTGINPVLEVEDEGRKIKVVYTSMDDYSNLTVGDDVEVIYPKGKVENLQIYSEKGIYSLQIAIIIIGIIISLLTLLLAFM